MLGLSDADRESALNCILAGMKSDWSSENNDNTRNDEPETQHGILDTDSESEGNATASANDILELEWKGFSVAKCEEINTDPLEYWQRNERQFPHVALQAQKLLCVPATSLPCERLFSAAGILVDRRRSSLRPDHIQQMLCLQSWMNH